VLCGRRLELDWFLVRQPDALVARRVRLDAEVFEDSR
jgi:hypothetical protein